MILEVATLDVRSGQEPAFETAFATASTIIAAMSGYAGHTLHRCLEHLRRYLPLVRWPNLEDHSVGFRLSPRYQEWRALLHHFYDPYPTVEHFSLVDDSPVAEGARGAAR